MLRLKGTQERNGKPCKVWSNTETGAEIITVFLYQDMFGNKWYSFEDLFSIPFIRQIQAKKVSDLYGQGLRLDDIKALTGQIKTILKSNSPDKYELAYAKTAELETLSESVADPVKEALGLCTVYLMMGDEPPDVWQYDAKMAALRLDIEAQSFFLNWWLGVIQNYGSLLKGFSQIVSKADEFTANSEHLKN